MIIGNFATIDEHRIYVVITTYNVPTSLETIDIDTSDDIRFAGDPVQINIDQASLDSPLYLSQATVSFLCKNNKIIDHMMEMQEYGKVCISIDDMTANKILFNGIVEVKTFNQDYAEEWTQIDINAYDYMSTLENYKYNDWINWNEASQTATNKTIKEILISLFNNIAYNYHETFHVYYDGSIRVDGSSSILDCIFNEHIFYGEDADSALTRQEILIEILKYFNLIARQFNNAIFIYSGPAHGNVHFVDIDDATYTTTINFDVVNINENNYHGSDTQISYEEKKPSYTLSVDLEMIEKLFEDIVSDDNLTSPFTYFSKLYKICNYHDPYNVRAGYDANYVTGKVEFPKNMDMFFYDPQTSSVRNTKDLVEYDANNSPILQWETFYRARWQGYFIPFTCNIISLKYTPNEYGYCYETRRPDESHKLIINYNTYAADGYDNTVNQNIVTALNRLSTNPMMKIHGLNLTTLNPGNADIINYLVFSGTVRYSPPEYEQLMYTWTGSSLASYEGILADANNIVCNPGGTQKSGAGGGTITGWQYSPEIVGFMYMDQFNMQYYIGATPSSDTWINIKQQAAPVQFTMNNNTFKSNQSIIFNDNRKGKDMIIDQWGNYTPKYNLDQADVKYIREQTGFNLVKVPVFICECKIGDKYCIEVPDPNNTGHTKFVWMTQAQATAAGITNKTFTIGIWPGMHDDANISIFEDHELMNNKTPSVITVDGEAIPIMTSDNLSGDIDFSIIAPYIPMTPKYENNAWTDCMELNPMAPDCYKYGCWFYNNGMTKYLGLFINQMEIENFECSIVSDNVNIDEDAAETSITYTNERPEVPEEYKFKIASGLTSQEYIDNNIISGPAWNYIYNGNAPVLSITNPNYTMKPEKMFIQRMADMMEKPTKYITSTLGDDIDMNGLITFRWDANKTYVPVSCDYNVKECKKTFKLVNHRPWQMEKDYFYIEALNDGTFNIALKGTGTYYYSLDNGITWIERTASTSNIAMTTGQRCYVKGNIAPNTSSSGTYSYAGTLSFTSDNMYHNVGGKLRYIWTDNDTDTTPVCAYTRMFNTNRYIKSAYDLKVECDALRVCFHMFNGCLGLVTPMKELSGAAESYAFTGMFQSCSNMTTTPDMRGITSVSTNTFYNMFYGCTSLVYPPNYIITQDKNGGTNTYRNMFYGCTSLIRGIDDLRGVRSGSGNTTGLYGLCSSLKSIRCHWTSNIPSSYTGWLSGVGENGTLYAKQGAQWPDGSLPPTWSIVYEA